MAAVRILMARNTGINTRTAMAPFAAFTSACILGFYTRHSIRVARYDAQKHRYLH